ncbi:MAG: hypothetical protein JWP46_2239, partial [Modestobacter sp.]|nr:hypothetical protein [Modestobacter sp.]
TGAPCGTATDGHRRPGLTRAGPRPGRARPGRTRPKRMAADGRAAAAGRAGAAPPRPAALPRSLRGDRAAARDGRRVRGQLHRRPRPATAPRHPGRRRRDTGRELPVVGEQQIYAIVDERQQPPVVYVSSASGASVARAVEQLVQALPRSLAVRVVDLHPLPRSDPRGLSAFRHHRRDHPGLRHGPPVAGQRRRYRAAAVAGPHRRTRRLHRCGAGRGVRPAARGTERPLRRDLADPHAADRDRGVVQLGRWSSWWAAGRSRRPGPRSPPCTPATSDAPAEERAPGRIERNTPFLITILVAVIVAAVRSRGWSTTATGSTSRAPSPRPRSSGW